MMIFKARIIQDCKKINVKVYKPIWGLVFKCNDSGKKFNSIQFSQEYNNQKIERKKKDQTKT
jgi:Na+-translocating ferredoxin:NAD+ oxidoreductase RnfC subunit